MKEQSLNLNRPWEATDIVGQMQAHLVLYYTPEEPESNVVLTALASSGLYASLSLTQAETLALVKALRQIPSIEQATVPGAASDEKETRS